MPKLKLGCKLLLLFLMGGAAYFGLETLWRGFSPPSMFVLGGVCFVLVGFINEFLPWYMELELQALLGAAIITAAEFATGLTVNVWLGLNVWDYSALPLNFMGQISLQYFLLWIPLSAVAIILDDYIRYRLFGEKRPRYCLLSSKIGQILAKSLDKKHRS